jgi:putative endonuclease
VAWVYILQCGDESLYVGSTSNLGERVRMHAEGRGGSHTAARRPVRLVYHEERWTTPGSGSNRSNAGVA